MAKKGKSGSYRVGYGKPPPHGRFVKGQVGNPKGRPRGSKNFKTQLRAELSRPAHFTENGKHRRSNKLGAVAVQLVNKSLGGDPRAMALLLNAIARLEAELDGESSLPAFDQKDEQTIESIVKRIRESGGTPTAPKSEADPKDSSISPSDPKQPDSENDNDPSADA